MIYLITLIVSNMVFGLLFIVFKVYKNPNLLKKVFLISALPLISLNVYLYYQYIESPVKLDYLSYEFVIDKDYKKLEKPNYTTFECIDSNGSQSVMFIDKKVGFDSLSTFTISYRKYTNFEKRIVSENRVLYLGEFYDKEDTWVDVRNLISTSDVIILASYMYRKNSNSESQAIRYVEQVSKYENK